jgi:hypothetical protein
VTRPPASKLRAPSRKAAAKTAPARTPPLTKPVLQTQRHPAVKPPAAKSTSPANAAAKKAASPPPQTGMALHTIDGARKYLTAGEREAFLREADLADRQVKTLCMTLAYAGCRLSEALAGCGKTLPQIGCDLIL